MSPEGYAAAVGSTPSIVTTCNVVAASVFVLYDHLITLGDEVELVWRAKHTWVSVLFYLNRYLTVGIRLTHLIFCSNVFGVIPLSPSGCFVWQWFQVITGQILFLDVEILLITRVFAYYGRNRALLVSLLFLLAGNLTAIIGMVATSLPQARFESNDMPAFHAGSCIGSTIPIKFSSFWILPLITHSIVTTLTITRYFKTRMGHGPSPALLTIFVRDHTWVFIATFAVSLWTMLAWHFPAPRSQIAITWNYSVLGFCGSRLILNLRAAAHGGLKTDPTYVISDVKFKQYVHSGSSSEGCRDTENTVSTVGPKDLIDSHVDVSQ